MQLTFKDEVSTSIHKKGCDVEAGAFTVKWSIEFETKDWGIKSTIITIEEIEGWYEVSEDLGDTWKDYGIEWNYITESPWEVSGIPVWMDDNLTVGQLIIDLDKLEMIII